MSGRPPPLPPTVCDAAFTQLARMGLLGDQIVRHAADENHFPLVVFRPQQRGDARRLLTELVDQRAQSIGRAAGISTASTFVLPTVAAPSSI